MVTGFWAGVSQHGGTLHLALSVDDDNATAGRRSGGMQSPQTHTATH
jgi:hypothetical protein